MTQNRFLKVAIIGAGLSGSVLASRLAASANVTVFEKSRGVGGRMSTRTVGWLTFDHGAQYFTSRTHEFRVFCEKLEKNGLIAKWSGLIASLSGGSEQEPEKLVSSPEDVFVPLPGMNALCHYILSEARILLNTEVAPLAPGNGKGWLIRDQNGNECGEYDVVISTAPLMQTAHLFQHVEERFFLGSTAVPSMTPCFSLLVGFDGPVEWPHQWNRARVGCHPLRWISLNHTKPGRDASRFCLVAQSSTEWAQEHLDVSNEDNLSELCAALESLTGLDCRQSIYKAVHRWRFARIRDGLHSNYSNRMQGLYACGDWVCGSRIEDVWLAAHGFADELERMLEDGFGAQS